MLNAESSRRAALRAHVHEAHEQLDHLIGELASVGDYRRYVAGVAGFRLAAENALHGQIYPTWFEGWRPVSMQRSLSEDLRCLGIVPPEMRAIAAPATDSELMGMLYTLEGSALGGRVIARRAAVLGFDTAYGASHLAEQTAKPENWRRFLDLLENAPEFDADEAGRAAATLFRHARDAVKQVDRAEEKVDG
ncbi:MULTISPECIES: biliverdin-producing heme oxygenase [Asaia]|uniref:Heme oxygenase n=1 Tax=Asaia bogorensis TaxID=91915 RepID=A0A060QIU8_9PROT|nr:MULTISPECIES: biliverdin-producing heme oxygenase [Asaia]ETC98629.1 heme oxygenase [Asaia sp. SF2.1]CDG39156.1 hypothetical protein ASAP_1111 [Asaia bogorensis]